MTGLRQLLFGDAPLKAMVTLGMKYGAGDLIAQQATTPGGELNCARAAVFGAFGTYYGFVNYSVFRLLAWSPVPAAASVLTRRRVQSARGILVVENTTCVR